MNNHNGRAPHAPLNLTGSQRAAILHKAGLGSGWILMSLSEMFEMKKAMDGATEENERLNKQTAKLIARQIVNAAITDKTLSSARACLFQVTQHANDPILRIDALKEISNIDEAVSVLPKPVPLKSEPETPTEDAKG